MRDRVPLWERWRPSMQEASENSECLSDARPRSRRADLLGHLGVRVRVWRQTRPEAVYITVQPAFTLWGLPDCSERAEALAMLADQDDHTQNWFRTSKRTCPPI